MIEFFFSVFIFFLLYLRFGTVGVDEPHNSGHTVGGANARNSCHTVGGANALLTLGWKEEEQVPLSENTSRSAQSFFPGASRRHR